MLDFKKNKDSHNAKTKIIKKSPIKSKLIGGTTLLFAITSITATIHIRRSSNIDRFQDRNIYPKTEKKESEEKHSEFGLQNNLIPLAPDVITDIENGVSDYESRISRSDKILLTATSNPFKIRAINEFAKQNYASALEQSKKAVQSDRTDPEAEIIKNNSIARLHGNVVKIGLGVPIEGRLNAALEMMRGVAGAQSWINNNGGINGKYLEVIIANDGNKPGIARGIASILGNDRDIVAVIGHNSSKASKAALEIYELKELPVISPTSTSTEIDGAYFIRSLPNDNRNARNLAKYAVAQGYKNILLLYDSDSTYSQSITDSFEISFGSKGGNVRKVDLSSSQFSPRDIDDLDNDVDAIVLFPDAQETLIAAIGVAHANQQLNKLPLLGGEALYGQEVLNKGGTAIENMVISVAWFDYDSDYAKRAYKRWGGRISWRTATSYDATMAVISALEKDSTRAGVFLNLNDTTLNEAQTSSGDELIFMDGEASRKPILIEVARDAYGKPNNQLFGYQKLSSQ